MFDGQSQRFSKSYRRRRRLFLGLHLDDIPHSPSPSTPTILFFPFAVSSFLFSSDLGFRLRKSDFNKSLLFHRLAKYPQPNIQMYVLGEEEDGRSLMRLILTPVSEGINEATGLDEVIDWEKEKPT